MQLLAVFKPKSLVGLWIRMYVALKVDVVALVYIIRLQIGTQLNAHHRYV